MLSYCGLSPNGHQAVHCNIPELLAVRRFRDLSSVHYDWLVFRHEDLHDNPSDEVCHGTDAEHDHVAALLALEAHEAELCSVLGIGEEHT